ncbi:retrovirus-related pol polyprotein from transposon TNT 1-94, partial [Tanacetum coccineum]
MKIEESFNMTFDETPPPSKTSPLVDDDLDEEEAIKVTEKKPKNDIKDETLEINEVKILLDGCDFEHWLVVVEKPEGEPTRDEIIESYINTLAKVVG